MVKEQHIPAGVSKKAKVRPEWADEFNRRLDLALQSAGSNRNRLAAQMGISPASASGWRKDSVPSLDNLREISAALGVSMDWLVGRGSDQIPSAMAEQRPMERKAVAIAAAAATSLAADALQLPAPDDFAAMILRTHDWLISMRREDGALPSVSDATNFLRHALQFAKD